ncbi:hypothetical protein FE374_00840 [Georgenia yuyongxinii]|uniref:UGSC-like domain-containing protein n=1 Tax=Georgenia yuyongxinii TaxID=2589797 RepID=A0A5B8C5T5_9MICO|nr:hypothetical protein [Georgenia yuyongxinii]QDC23366.1 hypothetical protein FE374_00840 [Georgenia yuyongxinii]
MASDHSVDVLEHEHSETPEGSVQLEVLDPRPARHGGQEPGKRAPRLRTLENTTIGLLWNGKANGDVALRTAARLIEERVPGVTFKFYSGSMPCPPDLVKQAAEECDAVIGCTADCGSCTSWMTHDTTQIERMGKPTVILASKGFEHDVEVSARAFALPDPNYVLAPLVYNNLTEEEAVEQTVDLIDAVIENLTVPRDGSSVLLDEPKESWRYGAGDAIGVIEEFNKDFMDRDWGDGYPLWPPTRDAVARLMGAVDGRPDDVVCVLPPGNGEATVRSVAVNAAMAGCLPQEMPVVMASLRAIANMRPVPRGALMSTSAYAPLVVVNGPIARELGINGGRSCVGPGKQNEVNIRISRAIVFCLKNIGSWYPGVMDLDTIGTTRKHIVVVAENEDESPWEPYHVGLGYKRTDSTASVFFTSGEWDISIQGAVDAPQLARSIASFSGGNNSSGYFTNLGGDDRFSPLGRLLFLAPPHALPLANEGGFSKHALEKFMFHHGQEPVDRMIEPIRKLYADGKVKPEWRWLFELSPEEAKRTTLPVIEKPEEYSIVVVGSVRAKDLLMPTRSRPYTEPVTATPTLKR